MATIATSIYTLCTFVLRRGMVLSIRSASRPALAAGYTLAVLTIVALLILTNQAVEPRDIARSQTVVELQMDARLPAASETETLPQDREDTADRRFRIAAGQPF